MSSLHPTRYILLADDDKDHSDLFKDALKKFAISVSPECVNNVEKLRVLLHKKINLCPALLFRDINIRKENSYKQFTKLIHEAVLDPAKPGVSNRFRKNFVLS